MFPHGTELREVPLIGWDLIADVAVLGPVQLEEMPALPPFDTTDGLPIGADLFVIGYPGEEESFPQPTISRGILSRYRRWPDQEATYLQTDASLDGGQSGGVLASAAGAVVGMTVLGVISATSGWRYRLPTCCGARPPCWLVRIRQSWATMAGRWPLRPPRCGSTWTPSGPCRHSRSMRSRTRR